MQNQGRKSKRVTEVIGVFYKSLSLVCISAVIKSNSRTPCNPRNRQMYLRLVMASADCMERIPVTSISWSSQSEWDETLSTAFWP